MVVHSKNLYLITQKKWRLYRTEDMYCQPHEDRFFFMECRGKYGTVSHYSDDLLMCYCTAIRIIGKLLKMKELTLQCWGDTEATFIFNPEHLPLVAKLLKLKSKRSLSKDEKQKAIKNLI